MKRFLTLFLFVCVTLLSGVILSSCGESQGDKVIRIIDNSGLSEVRLIDINGSRIEGENGRYVVPNHSYVTVEISAKEFGVDFSSLQVNVNGQQTECFQGGQYSPVPSGNNLYYGYFKLPYIEQNKDIELLNVRRVSSNFTFELASELTQDVQDKLEHTKINLNVGEDLDDDYVSLYEFLTDEESTKTVRRYYDLTDSITENRYRVFKIRFDYISPYEFEEIPFKLKTGEEEIDVDAFTLQDKTYYIDLGVNNVGTESNYTILVDFSKATLKKFNINLPQDNQTFTVSCARESIDIGESAEISVKKNMEVLTDGVKANYENMKLLINGQEFTANESGNFVIPENTTPYMLTDAEGNYNVSIDGITYEDENGETVETMILDSRVYSANAVNLILPTLYGNYDGDGNKTKIAGLNLEGEVIGFIGKKYILAWSYQIDPQLSTYRSAIDLYDYNIFFGESEFEGQLKVNLKDILPGDVSDLVDNKFTYTGDKYSLIAKYNETTETFDDFELQFTLSKDLLPPEQEVEPPEDQEEVESEAKDLKLIVGYRDFKLFDKNFDIFTGFENQDVTIEVGIVTDDTVETWHEVEYVTEENDGHKTTLTVQANQILKIRLTSSTEIDPDLFVVANSDLAYRDSVDDLSAEKFVYEINYRISDVYFKGNKDFRIEYIG